MINTTARGARAEGIVMRLATLVLACSSTFEYHARGLSGIKKHVTGAMLGPVCMIDVRKYPTTR